MNRIADKIFVAATSAAALGVAALGYDPYPNAGNGASRQHAPVARYISKTFSGAALPTLESPFHGPPRERTAPPAP